MNAGRNAKERNVDAEGITIEQFRRIGSIEFKRTLDPMEAKA